MTLGRSGSCPIWIFCPTSAGPTTHGHDDMFATTDTAWAPWWVAHSDDKKRARLNVISHLLDRIPYAPLEHRAVELPDRQLADDSREPNTPLRYIPTPY